MMTKELTVEAVIENLDPIQVFIEEALDEVACPMKIAMQISIAVEEIFLNIVNYAYNPVTGRAIIRCALEDCGDDKMQVCIGFLDNGKPFNPLETEEADISLSAEDRDIGGLGIYMVKKSMDHIEYNYVDNQNILSFSKKFDIET
ncbi:MAG: ATP-binding protein [Eubacteriales bacterium]